jgi:hypothetical protein
MLEGEVDSINYDPSTANDKLVRQIHANFDAALAEVEHMRENERQNWLAYASELKGQDAHAAAMNGGEKRRDENYAAAGNYWGGVKAASNTQKSENATWSATRKDDREAAKEVQAASRGRSR